MGKEGRPGDHLEGQRVTLFLNAEDLKESHDTEYQLRPQPQRRMTCGSGSVI